MAEKQKTKFLDKLKKIKHKEVIIAVIAVIVMLGIYFSTKTVTQTTQITLTDDYCKAVTGEITQAVVKISGDKNAKVVINWDGSVENELAHSQNTSSSGSSSTVTIVQGSNGSMPIIVKQNYPSVIGVAVVISSANDPKIKVEIMQMLITLLNVPSEKIGVFLGK